MYRPVTPAAARPPSGWPVLQHLRRSVTSGSGMSNTPDRDRLVELRRELHRHPEPAWREFWTTARIVDELEAIVLDRLEGGYTGAVAVVERGAGPTVGLRVDIDGLQREESTADEHVPAAEGF